ncbi:conserved Plasmodium protein, unknown function [Plasmodium berghei]|uniref:Ookinete surface protein PIMMS43 n=2 Tax=Plasmodium berghei TaxID=5821 RepID=PBC43_PLABA|nr:ookinete surface-associated protein 8 [Plasmodium berghei ANKA]A0A509AM61.1 RecName: Full=Ookinete surface protein PIMMS43; Short=PbPIMMS43; Flags: Precursor [Plasmodium berghei ANKA]CXI63527.1 conserved Plasmodium protein, unknown function [Plasmodium berghei]SCM23802.1 conserved Plasmodium protein, unknown function [Plasmodium berghei]SCN26782.1 conserved Plasmodium protein, unknown function [Plasmodium berghei]SCO61122.1 conserved Plasmodium protein, unknown function [Plasmodium berghei]|eukprot:XP_034422399.1 ookinete surface-associated protein 8 [Plasmodium berghei ANKA]
MIKLCTFLSLFLIFFFLNLNAINGSGNTGEVVQGTISVDSISKGMDSDESMLYEKNEYDNYQIPNICFDNTGIHQPRFIEDNKEYLYNKIGEISNSFSTNLNNYTTFMHELYGLYNDHIDVSMDNFRYGYIFMQVNFSKHKNKDSTAKLVVNLYGSVNKTHSAGIELAQGSFEVYLNQCDLAQNKINATITDSIFVMHDNTPAKEDHVTSTHDNTNLKNEDSLNKLNDLTKIHSSLMENNIDNTEHFITVDKISECIFQVNKLEDFLNNCMTLTNNNGPNSNENDDALKKHKSQMQKKIYRETLFSNFKESIVNKDMEGCKKNYTLLMSNSIASKLMSVFVFIAVIIYIL